MAALEFQLLGPLQVRDGSRPVDIRRAKVRALLAMLLLNAGRAVAPEVLSEQLWHDRPPSRPSRVVQNYVSILRRLLEPEAGPGEHRVLVTRPSGYILEVSRDQIDINVFEGLAAATRAAVDAQHWDEADRTARRALALWQGPALADFRYDDFAAAPAGRLEEARRVVEHDHVKVRLALGQHAQLVSELEAAVRTEPLREPLWASLMLALYRVGRQADALGAYQMLRRTLSDELGLEPTPELKRLEEAILLQKSELDWVPPSEPRSHERVSDAPPVPRSTDRGATLPVFPTGFVGRRRELAEITSLVTDPDVRLLTITGPGGTGKTRLAVQIAAGMATAGHEVCFVPLGALREPAELAPTIACALAVPHADSQDPFSAIAQHLHDTPVLIVLDNVEHLPSAPDVVAELLAAAPGATVVATSRVLLGIYGEHGCRIPPLRLPDPSASPDLAAIARSDAVSLFVQRAQAAAPSFTLTAQNADAVADICSRVDGLPLAIELAAARIRLLSPEELARRLDQRLTLLTGGPRTLPERQRTLRATLDWSYQLLSSEDQELFRRLAVFVGGCTLDAAEIVAGGGRPVLDGVAALVDHSLLWRDEAGGSESRFRMLETIREYALGQLHDCGEGDETHTRHAQHYLAHAKEAGEKLIIDEAGGLAALEREHHNITAALEWSLSGRGPYDEGAMALQLVEAMGWYWYTRGQAAAGAAWTERALRNGTRAPPALRVEPCYWLGTLLHRRGQTARARAVMEECVALAREIGDLRRLAGALNGVATVAEDDGDLTDAQAAYEESLALYRERDDDIGTFGTGTVLLGLSCLAAHQDEPDRAEELVMESLEHFAAIGDEWSTAVARIHLVRVALEKGEIERPLTLLEQATPLLRERGDLGYLAEILEQHGCLAALQHEPARAGRLVGAADALRRSTGTPLSPRRQAILERLLENARATDSVAFESGRLRGAELTLDEALDEVASIEPTTAQG